MLELRPCQQTVIDDTRAQLRIHRNVLIQAATGFGKTVLSAFMSKSASDKGKRLYFICHRSELIYQTHLTFNKVGIEHGFIASGFTPEYHHKVQICSIDTLKRRYEDIPAPDICIFDEAQHLGAAGWAKVHAYYDKAYHIGLSATPHRLDGKGLGGWFDVMVCGPSPRWLIDNGHLSDFIYYAPSAVNMSSVHNSMGDFKKDEADEVIGEAKITGSIVKHYLKYARGKKTILFALNIKRSKEYVAAFRANGVMAVHLDGKTPKADRKMASRAFADGHIDILCNVDLFSEGYDLAAQSGRDVNIEAVILARPTQSLSLHLQQCGRALRPKPYPAIILDHVGNAVQRNHGLPDQEREWSLSGDPDQGKKKSEDSVSVKQCPECYAVHEPAPKCPVCGHIYLVEGREIKTEEGELVEISKADMRIMAKREQYEADSLDKLIELGKSRGYANPAKWASYVYTSRMAKQKERARV